MNPTDSPLLSAPILGARMWTVDQQGSRFNLTGHGGFIWAPGGEFTRARCVNRGLPGGEGHFEAPPHSGCSCGLYGAHGWKECLREHHLSPMHIDHHYSMVSHEAGADTTQTKAVFGIIEAIGQVELHRSGFRAEFARPIALVIPSHGPHRTRTIELAKRYRTHRIDSLLGQRIQQYLNHNPNHLSRKTIESLLPSPT